MDLTYPVENSYTQPKNGINDVQPTQSNPNRTRVTKGTQALLPGELRCQGVWGRGGGGSLILSGIFLIMRLFCNIGFIHGSNSLRDSRGRIKTTRNNCYRIEMTPDDGGGWAKRQVRKFFNTRVR